MRPFPTHCHDSLVAAVAELHGHRHRVLGGQRQHMGDAAGQGHYLCAHRG